MDIFEKLRDMLSCQYISDLRSEPNRTKAKKILKYISLQEYPVEMLSDLAEYLYGRKIEFASMQQAVMFFRTTIETGFFH